MVTPFTPKAKLVSALASQAEGSSYESKPQQTLVLKTGSDS